MRHPTAVILTALPVEFAAVRAFLTDIELVRHPAGTVYTKGEFLSGDTAWTVILFETGVGSNTIAAIEMTRIVDRFEPDVAFFVGIAGGLKDVRIGDVVAADFVYWYEPSKVTDSIQSRIKSLGCAYPLVQLARHLCHSDNWHKHLSSGQQPRAVVGTLASGEQVFASSDTVELAAVKQNCSDALAVEMEGWGFLFAAHASFDIPAIVVRGISDTIDDKNAGHDERCQPTAAEHAAAFAFEMLIAMAADLGTTFGKRGNGRDTAAGRGAIRDHAACHIAVDLIALTISDGVLKALLIERGRDPFRGWLALPGGFLEPDEEIDQAARRELAEETTMDGVHFEQLHTYSAPRRDPRGRVVSVAHLAVMPDQGRATAGSHARRMVWEPVCDIVSGRTALAFDHNEIVRNGLEQLRAKLEFSPLATAFCAERFTLAELRKVYELVWDTPLDADRFNRKVNRSRGFVEAVGAGQNAGLFRRGRATKLVPPMLRDA